MTSQKGKITEKASRCEVARGSGEMGARSATEGQLGGCFGLRGRLWAWSHNCMCLSKVIKLCKVKTEFYHIEVMPYTYSVVQSVKCVDFITHHVCFCFLCIRDN